MQPMFKIVLEYMDTPEQHSVRILLSNDLQNERDESWTFVPLCKYGVLCKHTFHG